MPLLIGAADINNPLALAEAVSAHAFTTPLLQLSTYVPVPIPLPGRCEVSYGIIDRWQIDIPRKNNGAVWSAQGVEPININIVQTIEAGNKLQEAAMAAFLVLKGQGGSITGPLGARFFFHPIAALLGIFQVRLMAMNIDHYQPSKGGVITYNFLEARSPTVVAEDPDFLATAGL